MAITDAATFCATLVDEWVRSGVNAAFLSPGSRSTPLALALAADDRIALHVFHDERAAGFAALGHGLTGHGPAVVACTSGTAATHFHAAVVEADLSSVPLLVCTADRPAELWDVGAPQTIDQTHLFGRSVRFYAEPGVPDATTASTWRSLGSRVVAETKGWAGRPGPAHLNLSFRDPLVGEPGDLPPGRPDGRPWHQMGAVGLVHGEALPAFDQQASIPELSVGGRAIEGVIVAGDGVSDPDAVLELAARLGWPILADHRSGCRHGPNAVLHFDALLRSEEFARKAQPAIVLRFGEALASKMLTQWLARTPVEIVSIVDKTRWSDPERRAATLLRGHGAPAALLASLPAAVEPAATGQMWAEADALAREVLRAPSAETTASEIEVARAVVESVLPGGALVVSSSMPVRDIEWFGPARDDIDVYANRGANGIDGVISTAIGVALTGRPTTVLIGDVALLHDSSALIGLGRRPIDLHIVVIDNDGGGIFSFLPQADLLDSSTYEQLFGTPHGTDLASLAAAHDIAATEWSPDRARGATAETAGGVRMTIVRSTRAANVAEHHRVNRAIVKALEARSAYG